MKAIILAAGYATRLYPLTLDQPKPLLSIGGRPMIEHILRHIEKIDKITTVYVVTNSKFYPHFGRWSRSYMTSKEIVVIDDGTKTNEDRLGAVGDIHFVIQQEKIGEDLLVIAGDNLFEFDLAAEFNYFKEKKSSVVALCDLKEKKKVAGLFGVIELNGNNKIVGFEEKPKHPKTTLVSTACYFFTGADVQELETCIKINKKPDNLGDFIKFLSEKKPVYGYTFTEPWYDIGSHESYNEVNEIYKQKVIKKKRG